MTTYIQSISLRGFRAYLAEQTFPLGVGKSLAIYAPNAKGKSSLVDAIEFFFSPNGSLRRLGERRSGTQAGPEALEHVLADQKKIAPAVALKFKHGKEDLGDERKVTHPPSAMPKSAQSLLQLCKHDFVVRGHELRSFVENRTPEDRYKEVSLWFGLTPLLVAQKNLRALRRRVKELAESDQAISLRIGDLKKATKNGVTAWSEASVVSWINNSILKPLDNVLALKSLSTGDEAYKSVLARRAEEADALGLTALRQLRDAATAVFDATSTGGKGAIAEFEAACTVYGNAEVVEAKERTKAEKSAFHDLWVEAEKVFSNAENKIDTCPVCDTALAQTAKGSREHISLHIKTNLGALASYKSASTSLRTAYQSLQKSHSALKSRRDTLLALLRSGKLGSEEDSLKPYTGAIESWKPGEPAPPSADTRKILQHIADGAAARAKAIEERQGDRTYAGAAAKIDELIQVKASVELAVGEKGEMARLHDRLDATALSIDREVANHISSLLDELKDEINDLYKKIQGPGAQAPSIRIEPPGPEDKGQLRLNLVVDFSVNRKGVVPGGYLSDSQVHTLALSLRLAALKLFNKELPIAILDDVVTSYDADHRKAIAALLAESFPDFQFLVVTHDERFFIYLKEHLPPGNWVFRQITHLEDDFGPRYTHHRITDDIIEEKLKRDEAAANEIRKAEEEWLSSKAREFGIDVRIRDIDKPYSYDRGELAAALASFLKAKKIETPTIAGFSNPFWDSLQKGTVENFGSHFQDAPGASWSSGDEKKRWAEFKAFRDLFVCPGCSHIKFKRPKVGVDRPLCSKCEMPFSFKGK